MTTLSFTQSGSTYVATTVAGDNNVLQIERAESTLPIPIRIYARIDSSYDWKLVKKVIPMPNPFICQLQIPTGMLIKIEVDGVVTKGGIL